MPTVIMERRIHRLNGRAWYALQWIKKRKLRSVTVQGRSLVAKEWLAEFMAGYGERIWQKSEVHRRILSLIRHR